MDNTNCGDQCAFVKSGFCKCDRECPYYVETWWQQDGNPTPKLVKDCFPKKFSLEQNALLHRFLSMQSLMVENRNRLDRLEKMVTQLLQLSVITVEEIHHKTVELPSKEKPKELE